MIAREPARGAAEKYEETVLNLLLVEPEEVGKGGVVRLEDRRARHLLEVLRVEVGRELRVGVIDGGTGRGRVSAIEDGRVELRLEVAGEPEPPRVDLILALPRPAMLHRVLQTAAAMGVGRLDLINAWRVEKNFFGSPVLAPEAIRRHLLLGAEQGQVTRLPRVAIRKLLVPFVRELGRRPDPPCRLLAHPAADAAIETVFTGPPERRVEIAIGPEGGWIDREVETFGEAGFRPVALGPWILRVETAVAAALAEVELLRRLAC